MKKIFSILALIVFVSINFSFADDKCTVYVNQAANDKKIYDDCLSVCGTNPSDPTCTNDPTCTTLKNDRTNSEAQVTNCNSTPQASCAEHDTTWKESSSETADC